MVHFRDLGLSEPILKALDAEGYTTPTPIQAGSIPHVLAGRDLIGCAQTGTGKTAAFSLPIIEVLGARVAKEQTSSNSGRLRPIRCLILTPTRELAIQIGESLSVYGQNSHLRHTVIFGGVGQGAQTDRLGKGVDILVATPGRLLDLMGQGYIRLDRVEIFVLDEADRMLDMGFINDVRKVLAKLRDDRQTLLFSATMPDEIIKLSKTILKNPERVEVTPVSSTAEKVSQSVYFVSRYNKRNLLIHLLKEKNMSQVLVFSRTKHGADKIVKDLHAAEIQAEAIHGNKSQNARQRALTAFKAGDLRVLVATDIAARGIDIDNLEYVINYDLSNESETYVHRIGRTGRAGLSGSSISFCDGEEREYLKDIEKLIRQKVPVVSDHPFPTNDDEARSEYLAAEEAKRRPKGGRGGFGRSPRSNMESRPHSSPKPRGAGGPRSGGPSGGPKKFSHKKPSPRSKR